LQDSVEEPEPPVILVAPRPQLIPVVGDVVKVKLTVPTKPLAGLTVIVEFSFEPIFPVRLVGFAPMVKSSITNVALAEWERVPLIPVMVSAYVPAVVELQETLAVPEFVRLLGEIGLQFRPVGMESVRLMVPVKPFTEPMDIAEVAGILTSTGPGEVAAMLKSVTVTVAVVEWDRVPLAPFMLRL
jgi:hypothetical protein